MNFPFFKKHNSKPAAAPEAKAATPATPATPAPADTATTAPAGEQPEAANASRAGAAEEHKTIHNLIILDESGSMVSIYHPALTGVNETLQTIRQAQTDHETQSHYVTLVAFDTGHFNKIYSNTPSAEAVDITEEQYHPCGGTPLYDAMGRSINELRQVAAKDDIVLVTIITDGYENSSREYNGPAIKSLVEEMKALGWVFTYIGANQDVEAVGASLSIDNKLAFCADENSTKAMFMKENRSRTKFFDKVSKGASRSKLSQDYFEE